MKKLVPVSIPRRVVAKYVTIHIFGLLVLAVVLVLAGRFIVFVRRWMPWILLGWAAKDAALFPFVWRSYDTKPEEGEVSFAGQRAAVIERLSPQGRVKAAGTTWRARLQSGDGSVEAGAWVEVVGRDGLVLIVRPLPPARGEKGNETADFIVKK